MRKLPLFLVLLATSMLAAHAHASGGGALSITEVAPTDKSLEYLRYIFGNIVDVIIGGTGPDAPDSMVGALSEVLNVGMLVFTGLIIGFVYINGIMNSAADGTPLGKSYDTVWVPLRMILALGLVLPYQGGYSSMQTGVIWIAGHGIGMANTTWKAALGYMKDTGSLYPPQVTFAFEDVAQNILNSRYCLHAINTADRHINIDDVVSSGVGDADSIGNLNESTVVEINSAHRNVESWINTSYSSVYTPSQAAKIDKGSGSVAASYGQSPCGQLGFTFYKVDNSLDYKSELDAFHSSIVSAVAELDTAMDSIAKQIAAEAAKPATQKTGAPIAPDEFKQAVAQFESSYMAAAQTASSAIAQKRINWWASGNPVTSTQTIGSIEAGWITAGSWYWDIQRINRTTQDILAARPFYTGPTAAVTAHPDWQTYQQEFKRYLGERAPVATFGSPVNEQSNSSYTSNQFPGADDGIFKEFKRYSITVISGKLRDGLATTLTSPDPVTSLSSFGSVIINILEGMYIVQSGAKIALATAEANWAAKLANSTGAVGFLQGVFDVFHELFMALVFSLGPLALFLTFYLPAIPMILWVMGVAGWFVLLIEAVIAAPLWAASHAMPEGQGFVGQRAMAGYMVLLSLFIRPTLMLIGFLASMMLMVVMGKAVQLIVIPAITSANGADGFSGLATIIGGIAILTLLMIQVAHRAYGLQTELPDKILRYIGGGGEQLGENDNEHQGRRIFVAGASIGTGGLQRGASNVAPPPSKDPEKGFKLNNPFKKKEDQASLSS